MLKLSTDTPTRLICNCCSRAFAVVRGNLLIIDSQHGNRQHLNALTADDLEEMARVLRGKEKREEAA